MPIFANACGGADTPSGARLWGIGKIKTSLKFLAHPPKSVPHYLDKKIAFLVIYKKML